MTKIKNKKNKLLLISWILTAIYLIYLVTYFAGAMGNSQSGSEAAGAGIAATLVFPSALVIFIGFIFNVLAWSGNRQGFALTAGILYAVGMFLFIPYFFFELIQMVLAFVGYSQVKKLNNQKSE